MSNLTLVTFENETEVVTSEKDVPKYGYLINRGTDPCSVRVMTFGGDIATWTLRQNEASPVLIRKIFEVQNGWSLKILWNGSDQVRRPVDPPTMVKDKQNRVIDYGKSIKL